MPTLSDVRNWDTEHLTAAADHWSKTATVWEDVFTHYWQQVPNPGGVPWKGEAAEAAEQQAYSDRMVVIGLANQLHDASDIATAGATELKEACRLVLRSVEAAQNDGFTVGEDFSVSDHNVYSRAAAAMRQAKAEGYAADIRAAVADLVAADERIATAITTAAAGLGKDHFAESGDQKGVTDKLLGNTIDVKPPQMGVDRNPLSIEEREKVLERTKDLQDKIVDGAGAVWDTTTAVGGEAAKSIFSEDPAMAAMAKENPLGFSKLGGLAAVPMTGFAVAVDAARGENVWRAASREGAAAAAGFPIAKASTTLVRTAQSFASGLAGAAEAAGVGGLGAEAATGLGVRVVGGGLLAEAMAGAGMGTMLGGPVGTVLGIGIGLGVAYFMSEPISDAVGDIWDSVFG